jgi:hypothetical protein
MGSSRTVPVETVVAKTFRFPIPVAPARTVKIAAATFLCSDLETTAESHAQPLSAVP